jgi:hypothetical protein
VRSEQALVNRPDDSPIEIIDRLLEPEKDRQMDILTYADAMDKVRNTVGLNETRKDAESR